MSNVQQQALSLRRPECLFVRFALIALLLATLALSLAARADESDSFTNTPGPGWSTYALFPGSSASVQNNAYRLVSSTSPDLATFGPARVAAYRAGTTYTDFFVAVDVLDWQAMSSPSAQAFGILARSTVPSPGGTNAYALTITTNGTLDITKVAGEAPAGNLGAAAIPGLSNANDYRMIFQGVGEHLTGKLYQLPDLANPIAEVSADDASYTSGINALFAFNQTTSPTTNGPADATFDNYSASVPEPAGFALLLLGLPLLRRRR